MSFGFGRAAELVEKSRAAERRELHLAQQFDRIGSASCRSPNAMKRSTSGIADIVELARRQDAQRHIRIYLLELGNMGAQPQRSEARRAADA